MKAKRAATKKNSTKKKKGKGEAKPKKSATEKAKEKFERRLHAAATRSKKTACVSRRDTSQFTMEKYALPLARTKVPSRNVSLCRGIVKEGSQNVRAQKRGKYNQYQIHENGKWIVCGGLVPRLRANVMPFLPSYHGSYKNAPAAWKRRYSKKGSGSCRADGKRVDAEVRHIVNCVRAKNIPDDIVQGGIIPGLWDRNTGKALSPPVCPTCGLKGKGYGYANPKWHRHTMNYMRDVHRLGIHLVESQVLVANGPMRVGTELDDLGILPSGEMVVLERKAGYQSMSAKPSSKATTKTVRLATTPPVTLCNTEHTLHRLQGALGAALARQAWTLTQKGIAITSMVVYVSGNTNAPHVSNLHGLECDWVLENNVPVESRISASISDQIARRLGKGT